MQTRGTSRFSWALAVTVAPGIFLGAFWLLLGFLAVLGTRATAWQIAASLAPGVGILLLVSGARRNPVPYGAGLAAVGLIPFLLPGAASGGSQRLLFGIPLIVVGAAFMWLRRKIAERPPAA